MPTELLEKTESTIQELGIMPLFDNDAAEKRRNDVLACCVDVCGSCETVCKTACKQGVCKASNICP